MRLGNGVHLILEPKGHDEKEAVKTQAAHRWVNAVSADGTYGEWRYEIVHDMNAIPGSWTGSDATRALGRGRGLRRRRAVRR